MVSSNDLGNNYNLTPESDSKSKIFWDNLVKELFEEHKSGEVLDTNDIAFLFSYIKKLEMRLGKNG